MMNTETVFKRFRSTAERLGTEQSSSLNSNVADAPFLHVLEETANAYGIDAGDISYAAMLQLVQATAGQFADKGYGQGMRVGLLLENRPLFLQIWLALNSLGVSVVPINPDLRLAELEYLVEHSEMCLAMVLPERVGDVQSAIDSAGLTTPVISSLDELPEVRLSERSTQSINATESEINSRTECALLYTSGTTGKPKGCLLNNE